MKINQSLLLLLFSFGSATAQTLTSEMKDAFESNNFELLSQEIKLQNTSFDACFEVEEGLKPYSLLEISAKYNNLTILKNVLKQNVDINKMCFDKTALMSAAKYGKIEIVKELLKAGADKKITNVKGNDALYYAKREGHADVVELLK